VLPVFSYKLHYKLPKAVAPFSGGNPNPMIGWCKDEDLVLCLNLGHPSCYGLDLNVFPNSCLKGLVPNAEVFRGEDFGR
jgi:hypothetical protein